MNPEEEHCKKENMTDMDALCAWRMGMEAYKAFRRLGGTLPHDAIESNIPTHDAKSNER